MVSESRLKVSAKAVFQTARKNIIHVGGGSVCSFSSQWVCWHVPYLSDEFLLFGRFRHAADLLVQLFEGRCSITLSFRWPDSGGAADFSSNCSHGGRRGGSCHRRRGLIFSPGTVPECQAILERSDMWPDMLSSLTLLKPQALFNRHDSKKMCTAESHTVLTY